MNLRQLANPQLSDRVARPEREVDLNPYASPILRDEPVKPLLARDQWHLLRMQVADVQKQAMRRRVVIEGDVEAEICYDGWVPNELVTVNGLKRFPGNIVLFSIVGPFIHFEVETCAHRVPAVVEAKATFSLRSFLRLKEFRIHIGGRLVYADEG